LENENFHPELSSEGVWILKKPFLGSKMSLIVSGKKHHLRDLQSDICASFEGNAYWKFDSSFISLFEQKLFSQDNPEALYSIFDQISLDFHQLLLSESNTHLFTIADCNIDLKKSAVILDQQKQLNFDIDLKGVEPANLFSEESLSGMLGYLELSTFSLKGRVSIPIKENFKLEVDSFNFSNAFRKSETKFMIEKTLSVDSQSHHEKYRFSYDQKSSPVLPSTYVSKLYPAYFHLLDMKGYFDSQPHLRHFLMNHSAEICELLSKNFYYEPLKIQLIGNLDHKKSSQGHIQDKRIDLQKGYFEMGPLSIDIETVMDFDSEKSNLRSIYFSLSNYKESLKALTDYYHEWRMLFITSKLISPQAMPLITPKALNEMIHFLELLSEQTQDQNKLLIHYVKKDKQETIGPFDIDTFSFNFIQLMVDLSQEFKQQTPDVVHNRALER
jgi:hypothetical protein